MLQETFPWDRQQFEDSAAEAWQEYLDDYEGPHSIGDVFEIGIVGLQGIGPIVNTLQRRALLAGIDADDMRQAIEDEVNWAEGQLTAAQVKAIADAIEANSTPAPPKDPD